MTSPTTRSLLMRAVLDLVFHLLEAHAGEPAVLDHERLGRVIDDDLDVLLLGVLELPRRRP